MGIVSAYVKPGPKVGQAKTSKFTLDIQKNTKEAVVKESSSTDNLNNDNVLKTIEEDCFVELKNSIARAFPDLKSVYLAIPIECFREIAEKLPTSKSELQDIEQMTHLRVEKFGAHLLEVCKDYNTKRLNYLEDKQSAQMLAKQEEASTFSTPTSDNPIYQNDSQRRNSWMGKSSTGGRGRGGFGS